MVDRRLTWLAAIILFWGAAISYKLVSLQIVKHRQYASPPGTPRGESGAPRHDLRPQWPSAGHEQSDQLGVYQPAAGARPGDRLRPPGPGPAPQSRRTPGQHAGGLREPSRIPVDQ